MSLKDQYPSLPDGYLLSDVVKAALQKNGVVPDPGIVGDLTQATNEYFSEHVQTVVGP